LFIAIQVVNIQVRESRDALSAANNDVSLAELKLQRAEKAIAKGRRGAEQKKSKAQQAIAEAKAIQLDVKVTSDYWNNIAQTLGGIMVFLLLIDAILLPKLVRQRNSTEKINSDAEFHCPTVEAEHDDRREPFFFNRIVSMINGFTGEFVAYWSLIAVFVYYYEVITRYIFNSPTNWAHESMFLMFGMQYLLAGGFVLREGGHVRVDVIYSRLPKRGKAMVDILTSVFFFIFMLTLLVTGWTFFRDSYEVGEVSFTEWAIQYWPIKFAIPLGAALLLLQGLAQLAKDIVIVINPEAAPLDTEVRPEG
jgi:TRAP-type mannitol/chloroaromatic compound transport system permease small subunit